MIECDNPGVSGRVSVANVEVVEIKIPVGQLRLGMFVCRLDRPWLETSFRLQGFVLDSEEQIFEICRYCEHVFIDDKRRMTDPRRERGFRHMQLDRLTRPEALARLDRMGYRHMRGPDRPVLIPLEYPPTMRMPLDLGRARNAWKQARAVVNQCISRAKSGKPLPVDEIENAVIPIVESVVRGPDASMWLAAQRRNEPYPIAHPLNCCALVLTYARFLGFPPEILVSLARACLVFDIGMWRLDQNYYINRSRVDGDSRIMIEEHVITGLEYLNQSGFVDLDAVLAITHHHERYDGDGYPRRVRGDKVSLMGFMLQIADTFDAICSRRSYESEHSVNDAQRALIAGRETACPGEVIEQFFQALGVYMTGSMVELSDGGIAAVSGQAGTSRLYPWLIRLTHPDGSRAGQNEEVWAGEMIKQTEPIKIVRTLPLNYGGLRLDTVEPSHPDP